MAQNNQPTNTMTNEVTITFQIKAGNPFDLKKKKENLEAFARLEMDDQERIEQIIKSPKALKALKDKWLMLKAMFT
ncbi:hypothetical protein FUA48_08620 [Flavobacterium alkalisoli]|uniref:Uncharacterized protein n=1 Tax=Flavobacterium alkalisoli TaxID=2602769 RepID=A0A5B9FRX1_9FLAO|nr:hypothetical protein [Flavobacterium alkalisoli]QEE49644.1 hypothetical protein FUA48_08620 [Flavobacterium alkalisoli]